MAMLRTSNGLRHAKAAQGEVRGNFAVSGQARRAERSTFQQLSTAQSSVADRYWY